MNPTPLSGQYGELKKAAIEASRKRDEERFEFFPTRGAIEIEQAEQREAEARRLLERVQSVLEEGVLKLAVIGRDISAFLEAKP